jgi:hypothetical protein
MTVCGLRKGKETLGVVSAVDRPARWKCCDASILNTPILG